MMNQITINIMVRIDLAELPCVLTVPQLQAVMWGLAQVIAAQQTIQK